MRYCLDKQRGVSPSKTLVEQKLTARNKQTEEFRQALAAQLVNLKQADEVHNDFNMEMSRFIPKQIKLRTVDNPEY